MIKWRKNTPRLGLLVLNLEQDTVSVKNDKIIIGAKCSCSSCRQSVVVGRRATTSLPSSFSCIRKNKNERFHIVYRTHVHQCVKISVILFLLVFSVEADFIISIVTKS